MNIAVKKVGYFIFNYTDKIKTIDEFKDFYNNKCHNSKYDKCIFSINLTKTSPKIHSYLNILFKTDSNETGDITFYFNKKTIMTLFNNYDVNYDLFIKKLIEERKAHPECKVCFETFNSIITCPRCFFDICKNCLDKCYYTTRNKDVNAIRCPACNIVLTLIE